MRYENFKTNKNTDTSPITQNKKIPLNVLLLSNRIRLEKCQNLQIKSLINGQAEQLKKWTTVKDEADTCCIIDWWN